MNECNANYSSGRRFSLSALLYSCAVLPPGCFLCFRLFSFAKVMYVLSHPGMLTVEWLAGCMMIGSGLFAMAGKPVRGALLALIIQIPIYFVGLVILAIFGRFV